MFDLVREMNAEIQARAYVFLGAKVPAAAYADSFWLDPGDAAIFSHLPTSRC